MTAAENSLVTFFRGRDNLFILIFGFCKVFFFAPALFVVR